MTNTSSKIALIGRNFHPDGKETAADIAAALKPYLANRNLEVETVLLKDVLFDISPGKIEVLHMPSGKPLSGFSAVLMTNWFSHASVRKDMALCVALYFKHHNIPCLNSESLHSRSTSKLSQMMIASIEGVQIPRTIFCLNLNYLISYLQSINFSTPFILKDAQASRGHGNYLLETIEGIETYRAEHSEKHPFMAQAYIESDHSDFRFFVAGGRPRLVIKRIGASDSHLNNTSQGAATELLKPTDFSTETLETVSKMSKSLGREVTGIDVMFDKTSNQPYFLEANPIPQIATGSNVEAKLNALAEAMQELAAGSPSA